MMTLPPLQNWLETGRGLHRGALLLGALQRLTQPPRPAYLELGLKVEPDGLFTYPFPQGGKAGLDFSSSSLVYNPKRASPIRYPLAGRSQAEVFHDLFGDLAKSELAALLPPGEDLFERVSAAISASGRYRPPKREILIADTPITIDRDLAAKYWGALQAIFTGLARFRAGLLGLQTPMVVWPEHFDLSMLWFSGSEIDESQPHLNFGFAPFSEGIDHPYLYAYAYPYPAQYEPPDLPSGARWHTQGWTGVVLPYDVIAAQPEPVHYIEMRCAEINAQLLDLLVG
jgi:hypothetical protein